MHNVHPAALEAMGAAVEHARETSARIERAQIREYDSMRLLARSREDLTRSRARLAELAIRELYDAVPARKVPGQDRPADPSRTRDC
jgi:hypothetical protein